MIHIGSASSFNLYFHLFCFLEKNEEKAQDTPSLNASVTLTCSFLNPIEDEMNDTMTQTNKRPASPDLLEMETIKVQPVLKTYSRRNSLNKQKNSNSLLNLVSETSVIGPDDSEDRMSGMSDMRTSSSLIDNWNNNVLNDTVLNTSSPLLSSVDRLPSPVMELNSPGDVSLSAIADSPDENYSLSDKDIESSFSSMISSFNLEPQSETDLLSEAISNADICFNEDSPFYSGIIFIEN